MNEFEWQYFYWIPLLHKNPYQHRCITRSRKCSAKPVSLLLTNILTAFKEKLQTYCVTTRTRSGLNQIWVLLIIKELIPNLKAQNFSQINTINTYDILTLYTNIHHDILKSRLLDIIDTLFFNKIGKKKYSYLVISHQKHYFVHNHSDSMHNTSEGEIKTCCNPS
jgi:hypothetical protein